MSVRPTYTVQTEYCFLLGIRLTAIPDMSPWQRWGREGGKEEQMGVTKALILMHGPPSLSPWPLGSGRAVSPLTIPLTSIQFNLIDLFECLLCVGLSLLINISFY